MRFGAYWWYIPRIMWRTQVMGMDYPPFWKKNITHSEVNTCAMLKRWYMWCHSFHKGNFIWLCLLTIDGLMNSPLYGTRLTMNMTMAYVVNPRIDSMENLSTGQFPFENERFDLAPYQPTSYDIQVCLKMGGILCGIIPYHVAIAKTRFITTGWHGDTLVSDPFIQSISAKLDPGNLPKRRI